MRHLGMSGTLPNLPEQIEMGVFDVMQIPYSALERDHEDPEDHQCQNMHDDAADHDRRDHAAATLLRRLLSLRGLPLADADRDLRHSVANPKSEVPKSERMTKSK